MAFVVYMRFVCGNFEVSPIELNTIINNFAHTFYSCSRDIYIYTVYRSLVVAINSNVKPGANNIHFIHYFRCEWQNEI